MGSKISFYREKKSHLEESRNLVWRGTDISFGGEHKSRLAGAEILFGGERISQWAESRNIMGGQISRLPGSKILVKRGAEILFPGERISLC